MSYTDRFGNETTSRRIPKFFVPVMQHLVARIQEGHIVHISVLKVDENGSVPIEKALYSRAGVSPIPSSSLPEKLHNQALAEISPNPALEENRPTETTQEEEVATTSGEIDFPAVSPVTATNSQADCSDPFEAQPVVEVAEDELIAPAISVVVADERVDLMAHSADATTINHAVLPEHFDPGESGAKEHTDHPTTKPSTESEVGYQEEDVVSPEATLTATLLMSETPSTTLDQQFLYLDPLLDQQFDLKPIDEADLEVLYEQEVDGVEPVEQVATMPVGNEEDLEPVVMADETPDSNGVTTVAAISPSALEQEPQVEIEPEEKEPEAVASNGAIASVISFQETKENLAQLARDEVVESASLPATTSDVDNISSAHLQEFAEVLFHAWRASATDQVGEGNPLWGEPVLIDSLYNKYFRSLLGMSFLAQLAQLVGMLQLNLPGEAQVELLDAAEGNQSQAYQIGQRQCHALTFHLGSKPKMAVECQPPQQQQLADSSLFEKAVSTEPDPLVETTSSELITKMYPSDDELMAFEDDDEVSAAPPKQNTSLMQSVARIFKF